MFNSVIINSLLLSLPLQSTSFSPSAQLPLATNPNGNGVPSALIRPVAVINISRVSPSSALTAKKRRRRKNASPAPTTQSDELPDFDDGEVEGLELEEKRATSASNTPSVAAPTSLKTTPIIKGSGLNAQLAEEVGGNVDGLDEEVILGAMRGTGGGGSWQPPQSIQDTLSDRSLEKFMDFEKMIERDGGGDGQAMELPDFDEVISRRKQREAAQEGRLEDAAVMIDTTSMGKKAARNAQRKAAALQREAEIEAQKPLFEDFFKDVSALKLLENGAWIGIGLLVLWEFYINSPFFERAMPLIPVIENPPGM